MLSRYGESASPEGQRFFQLALRDSTIRAIRDALEESAASALLHFLSSSPPISAEKIHTMLNDLLDSGAVVIERRIILELYKKLDLRYSERLGFDFERMAAEGLANA